MASLISIVPDIENHSLVLHYTADDDFKSSDGFKQIVIIRKSKSKSVDIPSLARRILQQNEMIPWSRYSDLVAALIELNRGNYLSPTDSYEYPLVMQAFMQNFAQEFKSQLNDFNVSMDNLDAYTELFYEEMDGKIKGALSILKLASEVENLKALSKNDTLLCALSRVLREDGKKSLDLTIYIACIFSQFSYFADFHHAISSYKVGSICLEMVFYEILREESWSKELSQKKHISDTEVDNLKAKHSYEKLLVSYQNLVKKQNVFFKYALCILMNLGEDLKLEYKIVNKGIVSILGKLLERNSQDLLFVIVIYLKKLSIFVENKEQMKKMNIGRSLMSILVHDNDLLLFNSLKLSYNLMLDRDLKIFFIRSGFVAKIVTFLQRGSFISVIVSCLYLVSCESKYIAVLNSYPQIVPILLRQALLDVDFKPVLTSLLINMAANANLALQIAESEEFEEVVKHTLERRELQFLKILRNISSHPAALFKTVIESHRVEFVQTFLQPEIDKDLQCEALSILSNISLQCEDFPKLFKENELFGYLIEIFESKNVKNSASDDLLKNSLFFLAAVAHNVEICSFLLEHDIVKVCLRVLNDLQENDSVVLNVIYCFYVFVKIGTEHRKKVCGETKLIDYLFDLIYDRNYKIKNLCTATLDLIAEDHPELAEKIKSEKFNSYNTKWLSVIQSDRSSDDSNQSALEDMFLYPDLFLKMDILNDSSSDNLSEDLENMRFIHDEK